MNIAFENLAKIDELVKKFDMLEKKLYGEKRWLSTSELAEYIPYTKETINKKIQNGELISGVHFYQQSKMRIFDKFKIDEWITNNGIDEHYEHLKQELLNKITEEI